MSGDIINVTNYENPVKTKSGEIKTILWHNTLLKDSDENIIGLISSGEDITDRKKAEEKIIYLSFHDHLTGLYNRRFFEEELKRLDTERQLPLSFVMGDLNGLKLINDVFGHAEGDKLLKETAEILKTVCRSEDILARWGGDEFVILLPKTSIADAEEIVERIKKECKKTSRQKIAISLSLGTAIKESAVQDIQTIVIDAENNMYKNKLIEKQSLTSSIIFALEQALYEKSIETKEHTDRIHELAVKLGKSIKLSSRQFDELSLLASLHDIGKVAIPETILLKKGKLTEKEWKVIKRHPEIGFNIAQSSSQIAHIAKPILYCHENWDGSGYPMGIAGESIPVISRIILIADAYDIMTSGRAYELAMNREDAISELKKCAGSQFDPVLVEKFIEILEN
jgi:diguanylate cyclase (GGDEF)-like protein